MKNKTNKSYTESLLVLLLFAVLAVCVVAVLLTGAGVYERLTERGQDAYHTRTIPQYVATKVRQADVNGAVSVGAFGGTESLELTEEIDGTRYITRIYCYNGYLRELFGTAAGEFSPEDGEIITEAEEMDFCLEDGALSITVKQKDGAVTEQKLTLRSAKGEEKVAK